MENDNSEDLERGENISADEIAKLPIKEKIKLINKKGKIKLGIKLALTLIPLLIYIVACTTYLACDASSDRNWYKTNHIQEMPEALRSDDRSLNSESSATYLNVTTGAEVISINNVSPASSSFALEYNVWFDFDANEFLTMAKSTSVAEANYATILPANNFDLGGKATPYGAFPKADGHDYAYDWDPVNKKLLTTSGTLTNPSFYLNKNNEKVYTTRYHQTMKVICTIHKDFSSPRYPLESTQFTFYVCSSLDAHYYRFVTDNETYTNQGGSLASYISPTFNISDGFTLINDKSQQIVSTIYYYEDQNTDRGAANEEGIPYLNSYRTELRVTLRANRTAGWSLFLQAFLTLFAVMIWNFISFYNAAFNHEDVLGNLGAGLFSAVSSVLIGLSLISDSQSLSLVNMVNIFALAIILVMTFILMNEKRVHFKNDVQ